MLIYQMQSFNKYITYHLYYETDCFLLHEYWIDMFFKQYATV